MRIFLYALVMTIVYSITLLAQVTGLNGWDVCLDPGHSQTENMGIYGYSEAEKNLRVGLRLREMLLNETDIDTVYITRTNDQQSVSLPQRTTYANSVNSVGATWFHSIHSDAGAPQTNSTLLIWAQLSNGEEKDSLGGKAMSDIMIGKLTEGMRTYTTYGSIGDCDLYTLWGSTYCASSGGPYLWVNKNTGMPSELSEAGFHTNPTQNQLNMNDDWKRLEARTFYWSILEFHGVPRPQVKIVTGIVRNAESGLQINGAEIIVNDFVYVTDTYESLFHNYSTDPEFLRNGFYYFEDVEGDSVDVIAYAEGFDRDTVRVAMVDSFFTFVDINLVSNQLPYVKSTYPVDGDSSFSVLDGIGIEFSRPMSRASAETTLVIVPDIGVEFSWSEDGCRLLLSPDSLKSLTKYTITVSGNSEDKFGHQLDGNKDGTGGDDFIFSFKTATDTDPPLMVKSYPAYNQRNVELLPVISLSYNEELDPSTVTEDIFKVERVEDESFIDLDLAHYVVNKQSVINLFPYENLFDNERYITQISAGLKDLLGNTVTSSLSYPFNTGTYDVDIISIDNYEGGVENWWQPSQSGSTTGIAEGTLRNANQEIVNLLTSSTQSMVLHYDWDVNASSWLIRLYLGGGAPRNVEFDTSYILQTYIFGDGGNNKFRFALDEGDESSWPNHEVSQWYTIDWIGWKLVEWDLSDPTQVGEWIGNGVLDGIKYRIDSFQLRYEDGVEENGTVYFDDLRLVKKFNVLNIVKRESLLPDKFTLDQNYPNPFNPITHIKFSLTKANLTTLTIYDVIGRRVQSLVNEKLSPGEYEVVFEAGVLASGTYFYILNSGPHTMKKKMILLK
jgi:N-acetylmuramoyl-L-alanine amidase